MKTSPTKIHNGMRRQLQTWRETVADRQQRLGWKTGFTLAADQQRLNQKWPPLIGQSIDDDKCFLHDERYALERSNETEETNPFA